MIVATLLFVGIFAACNKTDKNEEAEKIYLEGDEYPFLTDDDGNKLLDENGEFIVYQTDEDGKYKKDENGNRITMPQAFQAYSERNKIEDYGYKILLPENWEIDKINKGVFRNTVTEDKVSISVYDKSYQDAYELNYDTYEKLQQHDDVTVSWEENVTDLGEQCEGVIRFTLKVEGGMNVLYIFRNHGNIYKILFESKNPDTAISESIDICNAISYKLYFVLR